MLIGLSGYARAGKDTTGNYLVEKHGFTRLAFADALKEFAYTLNPIVDVGSEKRPIRLASLVDAQGWEQAKKHPEIRKTLQILGTECGRDIIGEDVWVNIVEGKILSQSRDSKFVITDCRFLNEKKFIRKYGQLWWVDREGLGPLNTHPSENTISPKHADSILYNKGELEFLYQQIDALMQRETTS